MLPVEVEIYGGNADMIGDGGVKVVLNVLHGDGEDPMGDIEVEGGHIDTSC